MYEPAPHYVTVVEADGTSYSMRADEAGVAVVERAAFGDLAAGVALLVYVMIGMLTLLAIGAAALLDHALGQGRRNDPHHDPYRN